MRITELFNRYDMEELSRFATDVREELAKFYLRDATDVITGRAVFTKETHKT